jgi:hypothetical protein
MADLKKQIDELGIISLEGAGMLTEKAVSSAFQAIRESNKKRDEDAEWDHIKELQQKKLKEMQGGSIE